MVKTIMVLRDRAVIRKGGEFPFYSFKPTPSARLNSGVGHRMKQLVLATLLSSLLVAAILLTNYFLLHSMDISSASYSFTWDLLNSSLLPAIGLLFAAAMPRNNYLALVAVMLSACFGTTIGLLVVVTHNWGSPLMVSFDDIKSIPWELRRLVLPAAIAFGAGALWRLIRDRRALRPSAGV